jgi:hypothetical protein
VFQTKKQVGEITIPVTEIVLDEGVLDRVCRQDRARIEKNITLASLTFKKFLDIDFIAAARNSTTESTAPSYRLDVLREVLAFEKVDSVV